MQVASCNVRNIHERACCMQQHAVYVELRLSAPLGSSLLLTAA